MAGWSVLIVRLASRLGWHESPTSLKLMDVWLPRWHESAVSTYSATYVTGAQAVSLGMRALPQTHDCAAGFAGA